MITITRRLAQQLRTVLRRAFGNFRGTGPAIGFIAGKEGLTVKSMFGDVAVECRLPGKRTAETIWLPFEFLADVEGKNDSEVDLEATGDGQVSVQWRTGNVPQIVTYDAKEPFEADKFPALPAAFTANPPGLLQALQAASEVTAHEGVRYATDCIQLAPDGTINATDGRQLLIQSGFTFPWQDAVLVPRNKVFTCCGVAAGPAGCRRKERRLGCRQCRPLDNLFADQHKPVSQSVGYRSQSGDVPRPAANSRRTTSASWPRPCRSFRAKTRTTSR